MSLFRGKTPQVGDQVMGTWLTASENPAHYLAVRIGPSTIDPGDEIWLAWDSSDGTLCSVSVGKHWRIIEGGVEVTVVISKERHDELLEKERILDHQTI